MNSDEPGAGDDRYRGGGRESPEHRWAKAALHRRKQNREEPWFDGEYRFEKTVADFVPDCAVIGGPVNQWIEFVARSDQAFWTKSRAALRLGFVLYWVFHAERRAQLQAARRELAPALAEPFSFGVYDPRNDVVELGDPITYKNFEFTVEDMTDFTPQEILGYRAGEAQIDRRGGGFYLGLFDLGGCQRRVFAFDPRGTCFRAVAPGQSIHDMPWGFPTREGLERLVAAGQVTRLGPVRDPGLG